MRHPARYSVPLLPRLAELVEGYERVLDPFAGTGERLHDAIPRAVGLEIEPEWARMASGMVQGDALHLPFADGTFDAITTSPTYGNRMADHHLAKDPCKNCMGWTRYLGDGKFCKKCGGTGLSRRNTYTHAIGHKLHANNSGAMHWGPKYREFHAEALREFHRVLRVGGRMVINMKDHIKNGERQHVVRWWIDAACRAGFEWNKEASEIVPLPGNRFGENGDKRVDHEWVLVFEKVSA